VKLVDLVGLHVEAASGAPLVLLREHDEPHRVLPIFIGTPEAAAIAIALGGGQPSRPLTHDLMATLVETLGASVESVELTEVHEGTFVAALTISGPGGRRTLDARPSDAIALAMRVGAPVFASSEVLDEAGMQLAEAPDEDEIEAAVAEFRDALEHVRPADFDRPDDDSSES
jgi:bifunctional DNase/RNase